MKTRKRSLTKPGSACQITFELASSELPEAIQVESVHLVGEFNDWDTTAMPMTAEVGVFRIVLELAPGREYQFRYLINGQHWFNDPHAGAFVPNGFGGENCVVGTPVDAGVDQTGQEG